MRAYPRMGVPARAGVHPPTHIDASNLLIFIYITKRPPLQSRCGFTVPHLFERDFPSKRAVFGVVQLEILAGF